MQANLIARNPAEGVTLPKKKTAPKQILNDAQLERFMEVIREDTVWHDFFYTELTTGLRRGEICGLMWSDFDEAHGTLSIRRSVHAQKGGRLTTGETKTGTGKRTITLPPSTAKLLAERKTRSYAHMMEGNPNPENKELLIIPGAVHTDLYDNLEVIPFDKIQHFFQTYLK